MDALEFLKERKRLCNSYKNCIGKTVFLTREEAEKALEAMKNE